MKQQCWSPNTPLYQANYNFLFRFTTKTDHKSRERHCTGIMLSFFNRHLTYLLHSAEWFAASQEIPRISRNPKVHYHAHKRLPPVSILGKPNPVHIPTSHLLEIRPNIIHPSTPRSPQWSFSLRFPHLDTIHPLSSSIINNKKYPKYLY